jgi:protein TonB
MSFRVPPTASPRRVAIGVLLSAALLTGACGGPSASKRTTAAPPVAVKSMPPVPDLSKVRTFAQPIPGLPANKTGLVTASLQQLGALKYPPAAWDTGLQGWAVYDLVVDADGTVDQKYVRLVAASDDLFAKPAEDAVRAARFTPAAKQGKAVRTLVRLPVYFSLEQASQRE